MPRQPRIVIPDQPLHITHRGNNSQEDFAIFLKKNILLQLLLLNFVGTICNISVAGVQNVSKIVITPYWRQAQLQISEIVATETSTGKDLALSSAGATAIGTPPVILRTSTRNAIDGSIASRYPDIFLSKSGGYTPHLTISLALPSDLTSLTLYGRTDCCSKYDRYNIKLYDAEDNLLFSRNELDARGRFGRPHWVKINLPNIPAVTADTPATNFNCVENGTNEIAGRLYTKTTAQSFDVDIVALKNTNNIETNFASGRDHTVTVELVNANSGNGSCSNYSALSPIVSQSLLFTSSNSGVKTSASFSSGTAYQSVKCRITDNTDNPSVVGCSTDSFAIRPTAMTISSNLAYDISTELPKAKAGENFTLTTTTSAGYNGTPSINNSNLQAHKDAVNIGNISGSFSPANVTIGIATGTSFNYSEVGLLRFDREGIYDDSFTAVDQSGDCTDDFSNTPVVGKVGCKFGNTATTAYFGRFTPDHFDVTLNTPVFDSGCSIFTYLDQPITYSVNPIVTLLAKNSLGVTTQNYTDDYWKINPSVITSVYTESSHPLITLDSTPPTKTDSGNGAGLLTFVDTTTDILQITKGTLTAPFDAEIALSFSITDSDTITVANVDGVAQVNPVTFGATSAGNGISFSGSKNHRWGRVSLGNTHGSELTPLSVPLYTEYFNGTHFIKNTADNCTTFSLATNFSISDTSNFTCSFATQTTPVSIGSGSVKASLLNNTLITGKSELILSDNSVTTKGAGAGNTGYVDITSKLANLPWLLYDWDGDTVNDNCPTARATFGIFKGNEKQIYFREVY